ncbi:2-dehydropantoate 2-reductase [Bordetella genomosp. 11]|uniref:2-dehydropantoate 2-reductase n=1 Tax=Bordetella genomosp. 11 TaxID=1416808 RepID=A0A261UWH0_9BORD|nr:2-dehydropantoate 2-reductase [Bordetella genomosp. 11]OZI66236.1 2-dehydropantoate 2-reductase [Bordetella genomosp. 11]
MRMLFLGAGGTGGYFGGRAAQAGVDVTFLVREARAAMLREQGLRLRSPRGDATVRPRIVTASDLGGHYDVIVLGCKAYDLASAVTAISPAVGPGSVVLPIMNGMAHYDVLDYSFGAHRVLGGLCQINATIGPEGEIVHMGAHAGFVFGERAGDPRSERCVALERALAPADFSSRLSETIHQDCWEKFVFLCTLAAGTCLLRGTVGEIASTADGQAVMQALLAEAQAVSAAAGYRARPQADAAARKLFADTDSPATASMFRDLRQGMRVEADHIVGDMIARGAATGIATPYLRVAYSHLQVYQNQRERKAA